MQGFAASRSIYLALVFSLLLSACGGSSSNDPTSDPVPDPPVNVAPTVSAGDDLSADEQTTVTLTATASDSDGSIATVAWSQTSGSTITLDDASILTPSFVGPDVTADETLEFTVTVTDNQGATASDSVTVTLLKVNQTPTAQITSDAPNNQQVALGQTIALNGMSSSDADGDPLTYLWSLTVPSGSTASLSSTSDASVTFTNDVVGNYTVSLSVSDGEDTSAAVSVSFTGVDNSSTPMQTLVNGSVRLFTAQGQAMAPDTALTDLQLYLLDENDNVLANVSPELARNDVADPNVLRFTADMTADNAAYVTVDVSYPNVTTYSRRIDIEDTIFVDAKLQQVPVETVTSDTQASASGRTNAGFNLQLEDDASNPTMLIGIPESLLPDDVNSLNMAARTFNPNDPVDAEYFPGAYEDSEGQPLISVAFNFADIETESGESIEAAMQRQRDINRQQARLQGFEYSVNDEEPVIINRTIPTESCAILETLGDSDSDTAGFQVPVYTLNPATGLWELIGQGTVYGADGTLVPASQTDFDCDNTFYSLEILVTSDIFVSEWWNLDYPLLFAEPTFLCASVQVLNQDGQPLAGVIGFINDTDGTLDVASTYFVTDNHGMAFIEVPRVSGTGDVKAQVYFYNLLEFGFTTATVTLTEDCANQTLQTLTVDRPQLCNVSGNVSYEDGEPAVQSLMFALPAAGNNVFFDFAVANDDGDYSLNVECGSEYLLYNYTNLLWSDGQDDDGFAKELNVDGVVDDDELSDDGNAVVMEDFVGEYVEPLVLGLPLPIANQFWVYVYGTANTFPANVEVAITSPDGSVVYDTLSGTAELNTDEDESTWYFSFGQIIFDYQYPEGSDPLVATIVVTDSNGNVWPQEPVPIR